MRFLAAIALSLIAGLANAATVEVEWTWPTMRVDGTALPESEIREIRLLSGPCNATNTGLTAVETNVAFSPPQTIGQFDRVAEGPACLQAYIVATDELISESLYIPFTVAPPPANDANPGLPVIVRISLVWPQVPPPADYVVYSPKNYKTTPVNGLVDGSLTNMPGSNLVAVGSPCDCAAAEFTDAAGVLYCSVAGQIQTASNANKPDAVQKGEPFPAGSVSTCRIN